MPLFVQMPRSLCITLIVRVMGVAIDLDDQLRIVGSEIGNIASDHFLPPEFYTFEASCPKLQPKAGFGFGHLLAHRLRKLGKSGVAQCPSPNPLP